MLTLIVEESDDGEVVENDPGVEEGDQEEGEITERTTPMLTCPKKFGLIYFEFKVHSNEQHSNNDQQ